MRYYREMSELSERLTNDGRDALAALQAKLELNTEQRMAEERAMLKENLACECFAVFLGRVRTALLWL